MSHTIYRYFKSYAIKNHRIHSSGKSHDIMLFTSVEDCNTLQHAATHCHTLQHPATPCNTNHRVYIKSAPFRVLHIGAGT